MRDSGKGTMLLVMLRVLNCDAQGDVQSHSYHLVSCLSCNGLDNFYYKQMNEEKMVVWR